MEAPPNEPYAGDITQPVRPNTTRFYGTEGRCWDIEDPPSHALRSFLGRWKLGVSDPRPLVLVNLGCADCPFWPKGTRGGINIDIIHTGNEDLVANALVLPFKDGGVTGLYAHHIIEHIRRCDVPAVLKEWRRVLQGNGFLSIVVPDWLKLLHNKNLEFRDDIIFGIDDERGPYQRHQSAWSEEEVIEALTAAGFRDVTARDPATYRPIVAQPMWQSCVWARR